MATDIGALSAGDSCRRVEALLSMTTCHIQTI